MNNLFGANITVGDSLVITAIALGIVFAILSLLAFLLSLFKYIPQDAKATVKAKANTMANTQVNNQVNTMGNINASNTKDVALFDPNSITDENMIVAMLVASIEAAGEDEGAFIKILNIKEIC